MSRDKSGEAPRPSSPRLSERKLTTLAVLLAVAILLLGGLVLFVKLRPEPAPSSLKAAFLRSAKAAVAEAPDDPWAHVGLGIAFLDDGNRQAAEAEFEKALDLNENNWQANLQLAALLAPSDPDRAVKLLKVSVRYSPSPETPYLLMGKILYDQENYKAAKDALVKSVAIEPTLWDSRMQLGMTYEALGSVQLAREQYQEALRLSPGNQETKDALAGLDRKGNQDPAPQPTP